MKTCAICGEELKYTKRARKYCSDECRAKARYNATRKWLAEHPEKVTEYNHRWYQANIETGRENGRYNYKKRKAEGKIVRTTPNEKQ